MRAALDLDDIRIVAAKLSDENKRHVIAAAQALLFTQKEEIGGQKRLQERVCLNQK